MSEDDIRVTIRFPRDLYDLLEHEAKSNERSFNGQVIFALRYWMRGGKPPERFMGTGSPADEREAVEGQAPPPWTGPGAGENRGAAKDGDRF